MTTISYAFREGRGATGIGKRLYSGNRDRAGRLERPRLELSIPVLGHSIIASLSSLQDVNEHNF